MSNEQKKSYTQFLGDVKKNEKEMQSIRQDSLNWGKRKKSQPSKPVLLLNVFETIRTATLILNFDPLLAQFLQLPLSLFLFIYLCSLPCMYIHQKLDPKRLYPKVFSFICCRRKISRALLFPIISFVCVSSVIKCYCSYT